MTKRRLLMLIGSICLALMLAVPQVVGCAAPTPTTPTPQKVYEWKLSSSEGDTESLGYQMCRIFIDETSEKSGGRLKINHYPGDTLGDYLWCNEQVSLGLIDFLAAPPNTSLDPRLNVATVGYYVFSDQGARDAFGVNGIFSPAIKDILGDISHYNFGIVSNGFTHVATTIPFRNPEEAGKVLARVPAWKAIEMCGRAMGLQIVTMPYSEVYTALQLGTVDAFFGCSYEYIEFFKDAISYVVTTHDHVDLTFLSGSLNLWQSLSQEDQTILQEAADAALNWRWDQLPERMKECRGNLEEVGIVIIELTPEEIGVFAQLVREIEWEGDEALVGKTLMDKVRETAEPIP